MSLHAQLSPEAQAKLAVQKRNSTISAIIISLLVCTLLGVILWIIALTPFFKNNEETVSYSAASDSDQEITKPEMTNQVENKPSSPSSSMSKVIAANTPSPTAVPVPEITVTEPSLDFGDGDDFGDGWGDGAGAGAGSGSSGGFGIPASMQKRCTEADRRQRLSKEGGKPEFEDQVVAALRWLQKTQKADGSWNAQGKPVAMTGLALLAYLGHCETPASPEFGETVQKAIVYLINKSQANEGKLGSNLADRSWCYEHPIATYALAEAYTLCKEFKISIPNLEETVITAGNFIMRNQHENGGWGYAYAVSEDAHVDTSVTCWQLQALKACKMTKLEFEGLEKGLEKVAKDGIKYLEFCTNKQGFMGYNNASRDALTGGGALCYQQWGKGNRSVTRKMIKWINEKNDFDYKVHGDLYDHYYSSQAMINAQGRAWAKYNEKTMFNLAEAQEKDGSWKIPGAAAHGMNSVHYATCLSVLMLEVYYRFLPSS